MGDNYKIKLSRSVLRKFTTYVKGYVGKTRWIYALIEDDKLLKNMIISRIK